MNRSPEKSIKTRITLGAAGLAIVAAATFGQGDLPEGTQLVTNTPNVPVMRCPEDDPRFEDCRQELVTTIPNSGYPVEIRAYPDSDLPVTQVGRWTRVVVPSNEPNNYVGKVGWVKNDNVKK